jgi:hypothetical protein
VTATTSIDAGGAMCDQFQFRGAVPARASKLKMPETAAPTNRTGRLD